MSKLLNKITGKSCIDKTFTKGMTVLDFIVEQKLQAGIKIYYDIDTGIIAQPEFVPLAVKRNFQDMSIIFGKFGINRNSVTELDVWQSENIIHFSTSNDNSFIRYSLHFNSLTDFLTVKSSLLSIWKTYSSTGFPIVYKEDGITIIPELVNMVYGR